MDYETAYNLLIAQGNALLKPSSEDHFLRRLQQGKPPIPGQVTSILLALKIIFEALQEQATVERKLALPVYLIAIEILKATKTEKEVFMETEIEEGLG